MEIILMPKLGFNMDEGKLMQWHFGEGDAVRKGEPLFAIETDKTGIDVEATCDGVVRRLLAGVGDIVPVTLPIAIVAGAEEDISSAEREALAALAAAGIGGALGAASSSGGASGASSSSAPGASPSGGASGTSPSGIASSASPSGGAPNASASPSGEPASSGASMPEGDPCDFDVFVIGAGPGGYVAAIRAAQLGLRTAIAEKDAFGGVCLHRGCIPTKTFLRSAEALREVKEAAGFGVVGVDAGGAALDMKIVQERKREVTQGLAKGVEGLLAKNKVTVFKGEARVVDSRTVSVCGEERTSRNLIIATGSAAKGLPEGIVQTDGVLTSDTLLALEKLPNDIVVIGGGVIGIEFAYFLALAGTKVTVIEFLDRILASVDAEIARLVHADLAKLGIAIYTGARVTAVKQGVVCYEQGGKAESVECESALLAVGREPCITDDVRALGVTVERGAIVTDGRLGTGVDGVYAIGDANGKHMLAHKASAEGVAAAENIAGTPCEMDYSAVPSVVYVQPEAASIGLSEEDARALHGDVRVGRFHMPGNGKSRVHGDARGLIKVIVGAKHGEILGAHLYCLHASDMIAEVSAAMRAEAVAADIGQSMHPHPSVSEALQEAFDAALGAAIHA